MSSPKKPCKIPYSKDHYYLSFEGIRLDPNESIDGCGKVAVNVKCFDPIKLIEPDDFAVCFDGQWYPSQHTCVQKKCAPLLDWFSTLVTCTTPKGVEGSCAEPAEPGTKVTFRCAPSRYQLPDGNVQHETVCLKGGRWEKMQHCNIVCGLDLTKNTSVGGNNNSSSKVLNQYFWHAVIFYLKDGEWEQLCVGTVFTSFSVITAHNCFLGDWRDLGPLKVGVGNNSRDYRNYAPSQVYSVEGFSSSWSDPPKIVILLVDRYIAFSDTVGNVCFFRLRNSELDGRNGHIVASTKDDNNFALQSLRWATNGECRSSKELSGNIQADEFCSLSNIHTFSPNDIGAGLVVSSGGLYHFLGLLIASDDRIPVFLNISIGQNAQFMRNTLDSMTRWLIEKKDWFIRRKDDSE
ncbi:hypothetical protein LSTR_LSTR009369 [Laodelphax striatellus]|uniref:Sushi domain-containing protein n=1 Tax=Laodelphax striatellus TaxID=195883 RepID=A0A482WL51_LAOST|nr:hypothetical protein LSTR_LSTR009369 [Laodelphax striatellus]